MGRRVHSLMVVGSYGVFRECLARVLAQLDRFDVTGEAHSLVEARLLYRKRPAEAVIFDLDPAEIDPSRELRRFKREFPDASIIALGSSSADGSVLKIVQAGVSGFLEKDTTLETLGETIDRVLAGDVICSPRVAHRMFTGLAALGRRRERAKRAEALKLTHREMEILRLIDEGLTNKGISERLVVSVSTVKNHVHSILRKLGVHHRWEAAAQARRRLWLEEGDLINLPEKPL